MMTTFEYRQAFLASMSEAEFQQQVIDHAHLRGWRVAHFRGVRIQRADGSTYYQTPVAADGEGFPDLILVRGTELLAVELKSARGTLSAEQKVWLHCLGAACVETYVWKPADWDRLEERLR